MSACRNCKVHKGTKTWVGDGGALAHVHGGGQRWCECCVLKAQIAHAEQRAAALPDLRRQLAEVVCAPVRDDDTTCVCGHYINDHKRFPHGRMVLAECRQIGCDCPGFESVANAAERAWEHNQRPAANS